MIDVVERCSYDTTVRGGIVLTSNGNCRLVVVIVHRRRRRTLRRRFAVVVDRRHLGPEGLVGAQCHLSGGHPRSVAIGIGNLHRGCAKGGRPLRRRDIPGM